MGSSGKILSGGSMYNPLALCAGHVKGSPGRMGPQVGDAVPGMKSGAASSPLLPELPLLDILDVHACHVPFPRGVDGDHVEGVGALDDEESFGAVDEMHPEVLRDLPAIHTGRRIGIHRSREELRDADGCSDLLAQPDADVVGIVDVDYGLVA